MLVTVPPMITPNGLARNAHVQLFFSNTDDLTEVICHSEIAGKGTNKVEIAEPSGS